MNKTLTKRKTKSHPHPIKIVLTGGPGAGKTTLAQLFRKQYNEQVVLIPESATLIFSGGFPRHSEEKAVKITQNAIYHVQKKLEELHSYIYPDHALICDRGTLDGAGYWPGTLKNFLAQHKTDLKREYGRYDAVIFMETAAAGSADFGNDNNTHRLETKEGAMTLDDKLKVIWQEHPNFHLVKCHLSFYEKIEEGSQVIQKILTGILKN